MNSKKAITLLVLATMLLSLVPIVPVHAITTADSSDIVNGAADGTFVAAGVYDETYAVIGTGVTAGKTVELYWDSVEAWDGEVGLLNTTKAEPDGSFEVWFDVPESTGEDHYLWVRDASTGDTEQVDCTGAADYEFAVGLDTDLSSNSGLAGYKPELSVYGLGDEEEVAIYMIEPVWGGTSLTGAEQLLAATVVATLTYTGTATTTPIEPTSFAPTDSVEAFVDNGDGTLTGGAGGTGTIDYLTGDWSLTFNAMAAANAITCDYDYYTDDTHDFYMFDVDAAASALGTLEKTITIPSEATMQKDAYKIGILESDGATLIDYTIGAVITVDVSEGPSGTVVEITGKGFDGATPDEISDDDVWISDGANTEVCEILDYTAAIDVDADGDFKIEVVIPVPQTGDWEDYGTMVVNPDVGANNGVDITCDFDVIGVAGITVTPGYGVQGESIVVEGWNFTAIADEEVEIELFTVGVDPLAGAPLQWIVDAETDSNGHFEETIQIPAISSDEYEIGAHQDDYTLSAVDDLRIGMMIVIMSPTSGPTGTKVTLSGTGYTVGETWNATFNGDELFDDSPVDGDGNIEIAGGAVPTFYVPTMDPGTYTIEVLDIDADIAVEVEFTVTETTAIEIEPYEAPQDYNVTISGSYFTDLAGTTLEWVIYNSTEDWDMNVYQFGNVVPKAAAVVEDEGMFEAWWDFNDEGLTLDVGDYMINVTDNEDLFAQVAFSVVSKTTDIEPRKAVFSIGETVGFDVESSFSQHLSYIKIWDPSGDLYWETDPFPDGTGGTDDQWIKVGTVQIVPYYEQTAGGNPMGLLDDAPLGEWTWTWYDVDDDELDDGTFMVEAAAADVVGQQVADLANDITELAGQLTDVSDSFADVQSDIADVASVAADAVAAAEAATAAVNAVASTANTASEAAANAATAAEAARDAASGLTTLVYGAIGAALVAALAAIVSLMQISRRIAG